MIRIRPPRPDRRSMRFTLFPRSIEMRNVSVLSIPLMCLCVAWAQEQAPAKGYAQKPAPIGYPLTPVPLNEVKLEDGFWSDRMKTHINVTIPHILKTLNIDYSDPKPSRSALALVRTLEGVAYCLMMENNKELGDMMEKICENIGQKSKEGDRWFGGVSEAPVFYYFATGKENEWLKETLKEYRRRDGEYFGTDGNFLKDIRLVRRASCSHQRDCEVLRQVPGNVRPYVGGFV